MSHAEKYFGTCLNSLCDVRIVCHNPYPPRRMVSNFDSSTAPSSDQVAVKSLCTPLRPSRFPKHVPRREASNRRTRSRRRTAASVAGGTSRTTARRPGPRTAAGAPSKISIATHGRFYSTHSCLLVHSSLGLYRLVGLSHTSRVHTCNELSSPPLRLAFEA